MCSSFFIHKLYQREWNRAKIHFTIPKFLQVIDPYPIMSLVFDSKKEMWSVNVIKIIYILITTTVCLALYKWAVHNNCMECFLTERWDVLGIMKWMDQSVKKRRKCGETEIVKKEGGSVKRREGVTIRESKNLTYSSYVQLICTVPNILKIFSFPHTLIHSLHHSSHIPPRC
jgi:hypothetical protein